MSFLYYDCASDLLIEKPFWWMLKTYIKLYYLLAINYLKGKPDSVRLIKLRIRGWWSIKAMRRL